MRSPNSLVAAALLLAAACAMAGERGPGVRLLVQESPLAGYGYAAAAEVWPQLRVGDALGEPGALFCVAHGGRFYTLNAIPYSTNTSKRTRRAGFGCGSRRVMRARSGSPRSSPQASAAFSRRGT